MTNVRYFAYGIATAVVLYVALDVALFLLAQLARLMTGQF